jgi:ethanolamine utilization protein EutN
MFLGKVIGNVVATLKYEGMEGSKLLVVQPVNKHRQPVGRPQVAVDVVDAGVGDLVFMVRAREAAIALAVKELPPVDLAIVGVIDTLDIGEEADFELNFGYTVFT